MQCIAVSLELSNCHWRQQTKRSNQLHTITCILVEQNKASKKISEQYKSQWNRKRCYTNSEHCWLLYTIYSILFFSLSFSPSSLLNRIDSNWIAFFCCCIVNHHQSMYICIAMSPPYPFVWWNPILVLHTIISAFYFWIVVFVVVKTHFTSRKWSN